MSFLSHNYNKPGPGIPKDAPKKKGIALFFDILFREFGGLVKLNLVFILFCLPIVTIPAATTAMCRIVLYMIRDESHFLWFEFLKTFRAEFRPSLLCGLVVFVPGLLFLLSFFYYLPMIESDVLMVFPLFVSILGLFAVFTVDSYTFPMLALLDLKPRAILKNAFSLTVVRFLYNLASFAIALALVMLSIFFFPVTLPVILFILFSFTRLATCMFAYSGMVKFVIREEPQ